MQQYTYDSLSEFGTASKALHPAGSYSAGRSKKPGKSWDGGINFDAACDIAISGGGDWTEGTKRMLKATADVEALKSQRELSETDYSVTGHTLDIGELLSGNPEHWEDSQDEATPVLRVGVQLYTPAGNDMDHFINRGAALMSVLDDVIASGVDVELWGCVSGKYRGDKSKGVDARFLIKGVEHTWSPASVAFALCHPAVSRRMGFNIAESVLELQECGYLPGHRLSFEDDQPEGSDFDLWIGYQDMLDGNYRTPKSALERINRLVAEAVKAKANKKEQDQ
jgi:hypothetical protein